MIRILDKTIADKIAAGEVIERPISIIKELVENSIDAGSNSIIVEIKRGGKIYIRVTDDGQGIEAGEITTAFLRHATSKISKAKDLDSITTLGFRGEALASIAAVTKVEIISKTEEAKLGRRVLLEGGDVIENSSIGCPKGTTIIIRDLFYNTPARLKFQKSDASETSRISEFMSQIAVAFPSITFKYIVNGNVQFYTKGDGDLKKALLDVYGHGEYDQLISFSGNDENNSVLGYISKPSLSKSSKKSQTFFVNGRVISSKAMEKALSLAYQERLFDGRFPVAFIFLKANPENLDVNVHPNKRIVKFTEEDRIIDLLVSSMIESLQSEQGLIKVSEIFKDSSKEDVLLIEDYEMPYEIKQEPKSLNLQEEQFDIKKILSTASRTNPSESLNTRNSIDTSDNSILKLSIPKYAPFDFDELKLLGIVMGTYIIVHNSSAVYFIDQHAAHERIYYEKFVSEYLGEEKHSQPIFMPIEINVTPSIEDLYLQWNSHLVKMGFLIDTFGPRTFVIREIPTFMSMEEAENFTKGFLDNFQEDLSYNNQVVIDKLITKSCKSAIKAHDYITTEEAEALLKDLKKCKNPFSCPHGRPTFIKLTSKDLEKMFKRI